jgi:hypothetical protein
VIVDPLIDDAAIDDDLVASVGGTVASGATDGPIMIEVSLIIWLFNSCLSR